MVLPALWHLIWVLTPLALSDNNPNNTVSWSTNGQNNINFARLLCRSHNCQIVSENVKFLTRRGGFTQISGLDLNFICRICQPRVKAQPIVCESFCLRQFENFKLALKSHKILNLVGEREGIQPRTDAMAPNRSEKMPNNLSHFSLWQWCISKFTAAARLKTGWD